MGSPAVAGALSSTRRRFRRIRLRRSLLQVSSLRRAFSRQTFLARRNHRLGKGRRLSPFVFSCVSMTEASYFVSGCSTSRPATILRRTLLPLSRGSRDTYRRLTPPLPPVGALPLLGEPAVERRHRLLRASLHRRRFLRRQPRRARLLSTLPRSHRRLLDAEQPLTLKLSLLPPLLLSKLGLLKLYVLGQIVITALSLDVGSLSCIERDL